MSMLAIDLSQDASMRHGVGPAAQRPRPDGNQRSMWQREMERAETDAWFRQPSETPTSVTAGSSPKDEERSEVTLGSSHRQPVTGVDRSATSEPVPITDRDVDRSDADPAFVSSGPGAPVGPTRSSDTRSTVNVADSTRAASHVARPPLAADGRRTMNATIDVAASDASATAPAAWTRAQPRLPSGSIDARSIDAPMRRPAGSPPASGAGFAVSKLMPFTPTLASASTLRANDPSDMAKKVTEIGTRAAVQRAVQAATGRTAPVRMHIEWNGNVAAVWVGIDAAAEAALPGLIGCLAETLSRSGLRLRSVVCNGSRWCHGDATRADDPAHLKPIDIFMESES